MPKLRYEVRCRGPIAGERREDEKPQVWTISNILHQELNFVFKTRTVTHASRLQDFEGNSHSYRLSSPTTLSGSVLETECHFRLNTGVTYPSHMAAENFLTWESYRKRNFKRADTSIIF